MTISMRRFAVLSGLLLMLYPTVHAAQSDDSGQPRGLNAGTPTQAERLVLVLHRGQGRRHMRTGARLTGYRNRGSYPGAITNRRAARRIAARHHLEYLTDWWMSELDLNCAVYRVRAAIPVASALEALSLDRDVAAVERMMVYRTMANDYSDPYFELQTSARILQLSKAHRLTTGRNVTIAMIDTGVATGHPDLAGQISAHRNFAVAMSPGFSDDLHGTAVAGVMVARHNNGEGIVGVAPDARLVALKACWPLISGELAAVCNSFTLALAVNEAIRLGVDILNMSLTGPEDRILRLLIDTATEQGVVVVAPLPGIGSDGAGFPASMPEVIAVRSTAGSPESHSRTPAVRIPADEIITTVPNGGYNFLSGNSLGAALVSGFVALIVQAQPYWNAIEIREKLLLTENFEDLNAFIYAQRPLNVVKATP